MHRIPNAHIEMNKLTQAAIGTLSPSKSIQNGQGVLAKTFYAWDVGASYASVELRPAQPRISILAV